MTQPRWRDQEAYPAYDDAPDPYDELYRPLRDHDPRLNGESRPRPQPGDRPRRRWGTLPGRLGVCTVIGSAALGALVTAVTDSEPGAVLGIFLVAGTLAAALAVHPRAVFLIIPVPALAYLVTATIAALVYDRGGEVSRTALALDGAATGFVAMAAATLTAIVITAARWRRRPQR